MEERKAEYRALDKRVLVVAVEGHVGDWSAYAGPVRGLSHESEWKEVALKGSKLPEEFARLLFPAFRDLTYRS